MSEVRIQPPRSGRGARVLVRFGGQETSVTISEATDLHRKLGEALLVAAARYKEVDPRVEAWRYADDEIGPAPS